MARISKQQKIENFVHKLRVEQGGDKPQNRLYGLKDLIDFVIERIGSDIEMIELGSFKGISSEFFAMHFKHVICVDPWDLAAQNNYSEINKDILTKAEKVFDKMNDKYKNIKKIKAFSNDATKDILDESKDMIYIDSDHRYEYVKNDILLWSKKVKKGGIIAGHDYTNIYGVRTAVKEVLGEPLKIFNDCSWLFIK